MSSAPGGGGASSGGLSPLQKGALTLGAVFVGGYALGYVFGPLPSLEDLTGVKAMPSKTTFDGEVSDEKGELLLRYAAHDATNSWRWSLPH